MRTICGPLGTPLVADGRTIALDPLTLRESLPRLEAPGATERGACDLGGARCVAAGVDSVYVTVTGALREDVAASIMEAQAYAANGNRRPYALPTGWRCEWSSHGAQPIWGAIGSGRFGTLTVCYGNAPQAMEIRWSSAACWAYGLPALMRMTAQWADRWVERPRIRVRRIDLAADVVGWTPPSLLDERWVSRGRIWRIDGDQGIGKGYEGVTGLTVGRGSFQVCMYDKTHELADDKAWMAELWRAGGWDGSETVTRVEVRVQGKGLREMVIDTPRGPQSLGQGHTIAEGLTGIWRYMLGAERQTSDGVQWRGWMSLRQRGTGRKRTLWDVDPVWRALASMQWVETAKPWPVHRAPVHRLRDPKTAAALIQPEAEGSWVVRVGGPAAAAAAGIGAQTQLRGQLVGLVGALLGAESAKAGGRVPDDPLRAAMAVVGRLLGADETGSRLALAAGRWQARHVWAKTTADGRALDTARQPAGLAPRVEAFEVLADGWEFEPRAFINPDGTPGVTVKGPPGPANGLPHAMGRVRELRESLPSDHRKQPHLGRLAADLYGAATSPPPGSG